MIAYTADSRADHLRLSAVPSRRRTRPRPHLPPGRGARRTEDGTSVSPSRSGGTGVRVSRRRFRSAPPPAGHRLLVRSQGTLVCVVDLVRTGSGPRLTRRVLPQRVTEKVPNKGITVDFYSSVRTRKSACGRERTIFTSTDQSFDTVAARPLPRNPFLDRCGHGLVGRHYYRLRGTTSSGGLRFARVGSGPEPRRDSSETDRERSLTWVSGPVWTV